MTSPSPDIKTISSTAPSGGLIRPLKASDREPILEFVRGTEMFSDEEVGIALELIDAALTKPDQKDYIIFVHEAEGVPDGYYCVGPTPGTVGTFDLYWIVVAKSAQGRGIGYSLNIHAEEFVESMRGRLLVAETSSRDDYNDTRSFYKKQGYSEVARISDYYRVGDDLIVYGKYITKTRKGG